jgi:hypothetical protein
MYCGRASPGSRGSRASPLAREFQAGDLETAAPAPQMASAARVSAFENRRLGPDRPSWAPSRQAECASLAEERTRFAGGRAR